MVAAPAHPAICAVAAVARWRHSGQYGRVDQNPWRQVKAGVIVASIVLSAAVLWTRQTSDALLGTGSFPGAVAQVAFWAAPSFVLYFKLARSAPAVFVEGAMLHALFIATWWSSATDWHSTASWKPGGAGWVLGPSIVVVGTLLERSVVAARERHSSPSRT